MGDLHASKPVTRGSQPTSTYNLHIVSTYYITHPSYHASTEMLTPSPVARTFDHDRSLHVAMAAASAVTLCTGRHWIHLPTTNLPLGPPRSAWGPDGCIAYYRWKMSDQPDWLPGWQRSDANGHDDWRRGASLVRKAKNRFDTIRTYRAESVSAAPSRVPPAEAPRFDSLDSCLPF